MESYEIPLLGYIRSFMGKKIAKEIIIMLKTSSEYFVE